MDSIHNERILLTANFFNMISVLLIFAAMLTIVGPSMFSPAGIGLMSFTLCMIFAAAAVGIHLLARVMLHRLEADPEQ